LLRARAVPRWLWSAHASAKGTTPARGLSPSARVRGATCKLRPPTPSKRRVSRGAGVRAHLRSLSLGKRRSTRVCYCARAVPRWSRSPMPLEEHCVGERPLLFRARSWYDVQAAVSNTKQALVSRDAGTPALAGCGLSMATVKAPLWRAVSLLQRAPMVICASCGLQRQASTVCHKAQARLRSLSLERRRSSQSCCARAPCRAGCGRFLTMKEHRAGERSLFFSARS